MNIFKKSLIGLFLLVIFGIGLFMSGLDLYTDWLWFVNANVQQVFLTILTTKVWIRIAIALLFTVFIYINLIFTRKKVFNFIKSLGKDPLHVVDDNNHEDDDTESFKWLSKGKLNLFYLIVSIFLGLFTSGISSGAWEIVQKYIHRVPFNLTDPIFNKDIGFYVFELPFFRLSYSLLTGLIVLTGIIIALTYFLINMRTSNNGYRFKLSEKLHLSTLAVLFFGIKAFGYRLEMFNLLYSKRGVVFGASFTDVNVQMFALKVLMVIVGILAIFTLINIFTKNMKLIYIGIGVWILASIVLTGIYPGLVQQYRVEPNEIDMESPYIKNNIEHTLQAYNLDKVTQRKIDTVNKIPHNEIKDFDEIVKNIRLWDWRPLSDTYSQLQELRLYYAINNVDVDRYTIDGDYRQVMLAARELDKSKLESRAQSWINRKLKFTHGMGAVMSPVNEVSSQGQPEFFIKNIPPKSYVDLEIKEPRIYYGEQTDDYVIVNNEDGEFDFTGSKDYYYHGQGGIPMKNMWRRIAFALKYGTTKIVLSGDVRPESRLMFDRNIEQRVRKIAPFLDYDDDPYLVINRDDGKMYWILDAYTTTNMYPYSEPTRGVGNYIRNSVKVVIDAYQGSVDFYIADEEDPIVQTYANIFPDLFKQFEDMPNDLKNHVRYPSQIFKIQSDIYSTYHMKDPVTFFNKEDRWNIPNEKYSNQSIRVEPYYIITRLPEEKDLEFLMMQPFTPAQKNNMVAWLAAKSDPDEYGELVLYSFPRDRVVYGPMMIESRIDQHSDISQQLTLWDQKGSNVIRGNLLTIPIMNSILYVEPIFLQADQSQIPELKRVIVVYGDDVVMEKTLREAINKVFDIKDTGDEVEEEEILDELGNIILEEVGPMAEQALKVYNQALESLQAGDWTEYGEKIQELESILEQIREAAQEENLQQ